MKLYVGNLSYRTTEDELREKFEQYGSVDSVSIIMDRDSGRSKGFAFVEMSNRDEANAAINELNGATIGDRAIAVNEARPQEPRSGGGGGGKRFGGGGGGGNRGGGGGGGRRY
ncbi:MAG: RNA recognition motif domain-containing protein [Thermoguttaceae bacterium]